MTDADVERINAWVAQQGLAGASELELLEGFCDRAHAAGIALSRAMLLIDTLHPTHEGRAFRWRNDGVEEPQMVEYGRTDAGEAAATWQRSTFYHLVATGGDELRRRLVAEPSAEFSEVDTLQAEGATDYVALIHRFGRRGVVGEMDCLYSRWVTNAPEGFGDEALAALRRLVPFLALAVKSASLARIAGTLVEVYLGHDAGQRVLGGRIQRGVADRIHAVLWFSDLRGYTTITDSAPPEAVIPLLDDYADAVISSIHDAGGDVLKLIGDGTLAIFPADDPADACRRALRAEADLRYRVLALNARREAEGLPTTFPYLGLHIGDVFYGNIGSEDRLDFTVIGPAVNEVSRIASMCRSVDRAMVVSSAFAASTPEPARAMLVSVGRFALRGVGRAQELFTIDPALVPSRPG